MRLHDFNPEGRETDAQAIDAAIKKLRTHSGWWNGDPRAREILTELLAKTRARTIAEEPKPLIP